MRTALLLAATAVVTSAGPPGTAAPVPKHLIKAAENPERDMLQGRWKLTTGKVSGVEVGEKNGLDVVLEFRGDEVFAARNGEPGGATTGKATFDAVGGVKRLTFTNGRRVKDGKPDGDEPDASFGYVLDGDTLTLAFRHDPGKGEQVADPAKPDNDTAVFVFVRVKGKD